MSLRPEGSGREWVNGFLLLGVLVGSLGSLLIAWQYHIQADPILIGFHFLAFNAGYVLAASFSQKLLVRVPIRTIILAACCLGCASLVALSYVRPPWEVNWRMGGLGLVGVSSGALATALLYGLDPWFATRPRAALTRTGELFGTGCTLATAVVGATYFTGANLLGSGGMETTLLAVTPLIFFFLFLRSRYAFVRLPFPRRKAENRRHAALRDIRSIAAVLFSALLFCQAGNEFVIAGWLPLFLIHRLGANPATAIWALASYFAALTIGRMVVHKYLGSVPRRRLLFGSGAMAMAGYALLSLAPSMGWIWPATVLVGIGFAPIYPLVAEILDERFSYHPGFYNGIFSVAMTGAMSIPWLIGYVYRGFGAQAILTVPAVGSIAVMGLVLLILFEARLMSGEMVMAGKGTAAKKERDER